MMARRLVVGWAGVTVVTVACALGTAMAGCAAPVAEGEAGPPEVEADKDGAFEARLGGVSVGEDGEVVGTTSDALPSYVGHRDLSLSTRWPVAAAQDWVLTQETPPSGFFDALQGSTQLALTNVSTHNYRLVYGERTWGINLVWAPPATGFNARFERAPGIWGPKEYLRNNESYALKMENGSYVKYGERDWGINLVWSSAPVYEWKIVTRTEIRVRSGTGVGIFNQAKNDYLVYCKRSTGVDLRWAKDCDHMFNVGDASDLKVTTRLVHKRGNGPITITGRYRVTATPLSFTGSGGKRVPIVEDRDFELRSVAITEAYNIDGRLVRDYAVAPTFFATGLRRGKWRVKIEVTQAYPSIEVAPNERRTSWDVGFDVDLSGPSHSGYTTFGRSGFSLAEYPR